MNRDKVFDMFNGARDKYVEAAIETRKAVPAKKLRSKNVFLIAAAIAMAALLVGCGIVYVLKMQDLKLGEGLVDRERWDQENQTVITQAVPQQVLTLSGLKGTPNYQAAQEWYEFEQGHDRDHEQTNSGLETAELSRQYDFYGRCSHGMIEKINEICEKYNLKLIGERVNAQTSENLMAYLGIESVLLPDAPAKARTLATSYFEGGYFRSDFHIRMEPGEGVWPYESMMGYLYSPKDCFNDELYKLEGNDWQERNYTTKSGHAVLILRSPTVWESWVFCDKPEATVAIRVETIHQVGTDINGYQEGVETSMTDEQLNQILDIINFDLSFNPGAPSILDGKEVSTNLSQSSNGYAVAVKEVITDGYRIGIHLGITAPEGTDLEQYLIENSSRTESLRFADHRLTSLEVMGSSGGGGSFGVIADHDGKANTVDYYMDMSERTHSGMPYPEGGKCNLFLNGLLVEAWNQELSQRETLLELEGTWNFEFTIEDGDWREVEFISKPITTRAVTGWDVNGNDVYNEVSITSMKLRALGGEIISTGAGYADICDYKNEKYPALVLKDGSRIRLMESLEPYDAQWPRTLLPMDEIDHLELIDGTKLYPVNTDNRQDDFALEVKSAVTDGNTARVVLGLTVPYWAEMCKENCDYSIFFGNLGDYTILLPRNTARIAKEDWTDLRETLELREDGDGRNDTVEIVYTIYAESKENPAREAVPAGSMWDFHIEDMNAERMEYKDGVLLNTQKLWSDIGVRNVMVTFTEGEPQT